MVKYLIKRPVAVLMSFLALTIIGLVLIGKIPVSLLPNVDVPQMVIRVNYPNTPAEVLEQNILRPIRESLVNLKGLKDIESKSANHQGIVNLTFEYNTNMRLAYIEVNEKLDRLNNTLPRDMPRPQVMRVNTSDVPVIRLQVLPKTKGSLIGVSNLADKVLRKRLEQVDGVGLVDVNGLQKEIITVTPKKYELAALGMSEKDIISTIAGANTNLGSLSIRDGQYRYFVRMGNTLSTVDQIGRLPVKTKGTSVISLNQLAYVNTETEKPVGYHEYNGKPGIVITIEKQPQSKMNELVPRVKKQVSQFKHDYPEVDFVLTQDQTFLMDAGISNLKQDLIFGGILAVSLLFLFLGNWASPTLMSISIPLSLIFTFIFFYVFNISFNIISLSGLALGIGTLIDNSIIVVDSIARKRQSGLSMHDSSVYGTNEVITPILSQVLTTVSVYAPLVLLGGIAGALIFDQSIALTISLGVSLLVAFILTPLLYSLFLKSSSKNLKSDTRFFRWLSNGYHKMIHHILRYKILYFTLTLMLMPVGIFLANLLPVSSLPNIAKTESLIQIDWNAPIDAEQNKERVEALYHFIGQESLESESEIGIQQFLFQQKENSIDMAEMYVAFKNEGQKLKMDSTINQWFRMNYPDASISIIDAPNAFTQLFISNAPYFEARFTPIKSEGSKSAWTSLPAVLKEIPNQNYRMGEGLNQQKNLVVSLNTERMALFGISRQIIEDKLRQLYGTYTISELKNFGEVKPVRLKSNNTSIIHEASVSVENKNNVSYPLNTFISTRFTEKPKYITADKGGQFKSIVFDKGTSDVSKLQREIRQIASAQDFDATFTGKYFENRNRQTLLINIFGIVILLLYIILAVQYESLVKPLIVMLAIPLGITGSMVLLWATGGTLDVMAGIGFVVILGLVVDDPVLKVEVLTRLEKKYKAEGLKKDKHLMERMIHEAGTICLKPVLLTTLTTTFALVPVLFIHGIGNDLQRPFAIVIIGGLTIGTFFTLWFVPLAYWYASKWKLI